MLNIILLHHFDYPEGMATTKRFQLFADYFQKEGCRVTFVLKTHEESPVGIFEGVHNGFTYYKLPFEKYSKYPFHYDKRQNKNIFDTIRKLEIPGSRNIILTGGVTPEFYLILRKLIPSWEFYCDYVEDYTVSSSLYSELKKNQLFRYIKSRVATAIYYPLEAIAENFMFRKAKGISAISPYLYDKAKRRAKNVISVPITANRLIALPTLNSSSTKTLFFAGTGSLKDGLDIVAKAFNTVSQRYPLKLKISGKLTKDGENLIGNYCKYLEKVEILGFLSDFDYYSELQTADIMLMTRNNSKFSNAGFPFKLGEYLATGKPVITTRVSSIEKYLTHKKSAILIEPENEKELENAISFLIDNPVEAYNIGKEGYRVFEEEFLAEKNCKKLFDFISGSEN